mmetsp:Transcript_7502/g.17965  ORF Transcript_7502/g.17965 Transcript_7502/m.17965 type:complete len:258 (+) Transcript_7502:142-915(+)
MGPISNGAPGRKHRSRLDGGRLDCGRVLRQHARCFEGHRRWLSRPNCCLRHERPHASDRLSQDHGIASSPGMSPSPRWVGRRLRLAARRAHHPGLLENILRTLVVGHHVVHRILRELTQALLGRNHLYSHVGLHWFGGAPIAVARWHLVHRVPRSQHSKEVRGRLALASLVALLNDFCDGRTIVSEPADPAPAASLLGSARHAPPVVHPTSVGHLVQAHPPLGVAHEEVGPEEGCANGRGDALSSRTHRRHRVLEEL